MTKQYEPKKHIKLYGSDKFIAEVKAAAKKDESTTSAFIATIIKNKLKRVK